MMQHKPPRDYYCNKKFWHLKIDLESRTTYNCHAAQPHRVTAEWLSHNPGQLFNTPINVFEREQMLQNVRNTSCEQNCWAAEDRGQSSPRLSANGALRSHDQVSGVPKEIDLTIGSDCNLTCTYCCKEYSSAWRLDLDRGGEYAVSGAQENRYRLLDIDRVLMKVNQPELMQSEHYNRLLDEVRMVSPGLKRLVVTGGEPFLNNRLTDLITSLDLAPAAVVDIYTGLGVNSDRFARMLDSLCSIPNVTLSISAENIGRNLEFTRYGIDWHRFQHNLEHIRQRRMRYRMHATISNLTAFGFAAFWNQYQHEHMGITFVFQPRMQAIHVMDNNSKQLISQALSVLPEHHRSRFVDSLAPEPTEQERQDLSAFLKEFVRRRPGLDLDIYPDSFLSWLELEHVV